MINDVTSSLSRQTREIQNMAQQNLTTSASAIKNVSGGQASITVPAYSVILVEFKPDSPVDFAPLANLWLSEITNSNLRAEVTVSQVRVGVPTGRRQWKVYAGESTQSGGNVTISAVCSSLISGNITMVRL